MIIKTVYINNLLEKFIKNLKKFKKIIKLLKKVINFKAYNNLFYKILLKKVTFKDLFIKSIKNMPFLKFYTFISNP